MNWDAFSLGFVALAALARLLDSLMPDKTKTKLKETFFHGWLALEKISFSGMFRRAAIFFDSLFRAMLKGGLYQLLFFYCLIGSLGWLAAGEDFPIEMLNFTRGYGWLITQGILGFFLKTWLLGILILGVAASHALTWMAATVVREDGKESNKFRDIPAMSALFWLVDVLGGLLLGLLVYCLIFWCFDRSFKQIPLKLAAVVLAPKIVHLSMLLLVILLYLFEALRRFMSLICDRVFASKDSVLLIIVLVFGVVTAGGNAISKAFENKHQHNASRS